MASPTCSICMHRDLPGIDAELSAGSAIVHTAAAYGLSKSAVGRHKLNCLGPKVAAAARIMQPVRESRESVKRAKSIVEGAVPDAAEVLSLVHLLGRLAASLERLDAAADDAATDKLHSALAAVSGQLHRGVETAAKLQGFYATPDVGQQPKFSINIVWPTVDSKGNKIEAP